MNSGKSAPVSDSGFNNVNNQNETIHKRNTTVILIVQLQNYFKLYASVPLESAVVGIVYNSTIELTQKVVIR